MQTRDSRGRSLAFDSILVEAINTYRSEGTLGSATDEFCRRFVERQEELSRYTHLCQELYDATRDASKDPAFSAGDYTVHFALAFYLNQFSLRIISQGLSHAVRLAENGEYSAAWEMLEISTMALNTTREIEPDHEWISFLAAQIVCFLTLPISDEMEAAVNQETVTALGRLPGYLASPIINDIAHGLTEGEDRYLKLATLACNSKLWQWLPPHEQAIFVIYYWLPSISSSFKSLVVLDSAVTLAIIAIEDANLPRDEAGPFIAELLTYLGSFPHRARIEFSRQLLRLSLQFRVSPDIQARIRLQRAWWTYPLSVREAAREVKRTRALWPPLEIPPEVEAQTLTIESAIAYRDGKYDLALDLLDRADNLGSANRRLAAQIAGQRNAIRSMLGLPVKSATFVGHLSYSQQVAELYARALKDFRSHQFQECIDRIGELLAVKPKSHASDSPYIRRRAYLLRAAAHLQEGRLDASLASVLEAVDELTNAIKSYPGGTEQADRRNRFAEVEALLDRALQIVSQGPSEFSAIALLRLWESLVNYRDIELCFLDSLRAELDREKGRQEAPTSALHPEYDQVRDLLSRLELDGHAPASGESDADMIRLHADLAAGLQFRLYHLEINLSLSTSYAKLVTSRLSTSFAAIREQLSETEMLIEFVSYWNGFTSDHGDVGARSLMAFTTSGATPNKLIVFSDERLIPSVEIVTERLVEMDTNPAYFAELPVVEEALASTLIGLGRLTRANRILCVPDGPVKTMNLAALPYDGGHLLDQLEFTYLGHAADLLLDPADVTAGSSVVFGDVAFDYPLSDTVVTTQAGPEPRQFAALSSTAAEAAWVATHLGVRPKLSLQANAGAFRTLERPLVLHVATHGLFDEGYNRDSLSPSNQNRLAAQMREAAGTARLSRARPMDPALRSGLAFAGINWWLRGQPRGDDGECGYITAWDVSRMDFSGTRMVVLSGCRTGRGPVERYLGLVDLRRAVQAAGAWQVIAAIWDVPDTASALLMRLVYKFAGDEIPSAQTLREAQCCLRQASVETIREWLTELEVPRGFGGPYLREILKQPDDHRPFAKPYYWAGFICFTSGRARRRLHAEGNMDNEGD